MASQLHNFVVKQLQKGFTEQRITQHLYSLGYTPRQVTKAFNKAYGRHTLHSLTYVIIALVTIGVIGAAIFLYSHFTAIQPVPPALLDLTTEPFAQSARAGERVEFTVDLQSMGAARRYDVALRHELVGMNNQILVAREEMYAVETSVSRRSSIMLPDGIAPGRYTIKTYADYDGHRAVASFSIVIAGQEPTCSDGIQNQDEEAVDCGGPCQPCEQCPAECDDGNLCTTDVCGPQTGYQCVHDRIAECCGDGVCEGAESPNTCRADCQMVEVVNADTLTAQETMEKVQEISSKDSQTAFKLCDDLLEIQNKDRCFTIVADEAKQGSFCRFIETVAQRDSCYMQRAVRAEEFLCDKVENRYLRDSCESLKELS